MNRNNTAFIRGHLVCPTLCHISARNTAADPESSCSWMAVIMWYDSEQKTVTHHVFVTFHFCVVLTVSGNLNKQRWCKGEPTSCRLRKISVVFSAFSQLHLYHKHNLCKCVTWWHSVMSQSHEIKDGTFEEACQALQELRQHGWAF